MQAGFEPHGGSTGIHAPECCLAIKAALAAAGGRPGLQSRYEAGKINGGFTGCGKTRIRKRLVSGHDFSRAVNAAKSTRALAPEGCFPPISPQIPSFSAACLATEVCFRTFCLKAGVFQQPVQSFRKQHKISAGW